MSDLMQSVYAFDFVFDSQSVFRSLLQAMANPGRIESIRREAETFTEDYGTLLALGCTLLDNEEKMFVEKNPILAESLHNLTLCREGVLEVADYVFLSSEMNDGSLAAVFDKVKHGTYADPQCSATLLVYCESVAGTDVMVLSGPGIDGTLTVGVSPYVKKTIALRDAAQMEYPLGVEVVFCDASGAIMAVPRLVKTVAEGGEA